MKTFPLFSVKGFGVFSLESLKPVGRGGAEWSVAVEGATGRRLCCDQLEMMMINKARTAWGKREMFRRITIANIYFLPKVYLFEKHNCR